MSFYDKLYLHFGNNRADRWVRRFVTPGCGVVTTEHPECAEWERYRNNLDSSDVFDWATGNNEFAGRVAHGPDGRVYLN